MRAGHDQRRGDALVGHVADHDADPALAEVDEVVEVAAHDSCRAVVGRDLPLGQIGQLVRQELLLDQLGDLELLLVALALGGLGGLLADQLRDPDRGCGLRGEGGQQAAIVGRVVLLGQPRPEVERADQLALGYQRHDQGHARIAQRLEGRRRQLQLRQIDGTRRGLQVGEQRVGLAGCRRDAGMLLDDGRRGDGRRLGGRIGRSATEAPEWTGQCCHGLILMQKRPDIVTNNGESSASSRARLNGAEAGSWVGLATYP